MNARPKLFLVRVRQTLNRGKAAAPASPGAAPAAPGAALAAPGAAPAKKPAAAAQDYALGNDYAGTLYDGWALRWVGITMGGHYDGWALRWVGITMGGHYDEKVSCQNSTHVHTLSMHSRGSQCCRIRRVFPQKQAAAFAWLSILFACASLFESKTVPSIQKIRKKENA